MTKNEKKKYIIPEIYRIVVETDDDLCKQSWSKPHEHHPNKHSHCSNYSWSDDGQEYWHCDHSINGWTGEPFYPDCDFYIP